MDNLLLELEKALEFQQSEFCKETLILTVIEENKKNGRGVNTPLRLKKRSNSLLFFFDFYP